MVIMQPPLSSHQDLVVVLENARSPLTPFPRLPPYILFALVRAGRVQFISFWWQAVKQQKMLERERER